MDVAPQTFLTPRLLLRPLRMDDAEPIFEGYARDEEVTRFLTWRPHRDLADTRAFITASLAIDPAVRRAYVLTDRDGSGAVLGGFDLRRTAAHRFEVGYVLARRWWGQGLMTEALTEVVSWSSRQDGIFRIGAVCDVDNVASTRVMEKAGLVREGTLRRWMVHPNVSLEPRDCFCYAAVR